ncbi:protein of unknown function (plasmid) [Cupriavidus taiwanensis]|nr:protein of unknown function [Cupriavidus taiwanensis]
MRCRARARANTAPMPSAARRSTSATATSPPRPAAMRWTRVRAQVRLLQGNLVEPGLLAGEAPYDFVFCRNLLIYFDAAGQRQAVQTLVRLTMADGLLFVGPAEASVLSAQGLEPVGIPLSFAFRKPPAAVPRARTPSRAPVHDTQPPRMAAPPRLLRPAASLRAPAVRAPAPAARLVADTHADALAAIAAMADRGELDAAPAACVSLLDRAAPDAAGTALADAYGMLGVLHDAAGRTAQAHAAYRKALYLDPSHQESLYHLAALLDRRRPRRRHPPAAARAAPHPQAPWLRPGPIPLPPWCAPRTWTTAGGASACAATAAARRWPNTPIAATAPPMRRPPRCCWTHSSLTRACRNCRMPPTSPPRPKAATRTAAQAATTTRTTPARWHAWCSASAMNGWRCRPPRSAKSRRRARSTRCPTVAMPRCWGWPRCAATCWPACRWRTCSTPARCRPNPMPTAAAS